MMLTPGPQRQKRHRLHGLRHGRRESPPPMPPLFESMKSMTFFLHETCKDLLVESPEKEVPFLKKGSYFGHQQPAPFRG
jgi:hypothetical protein